MTDRQLPKYKCHKEVSALKIKDIIDANLGTKMIDSEEDGYEPFTVSADYVRKHNPKQGGYYIVYKDGYESYSPAKAFEEGYTQISEEAPVVTQDIPKQGPKEEE